MVGRFVYNKRNKRNKKERFGNFPLETGLACTGKYININSMRLDGRRQCLLIGREASKTTSGFHII
jgi:hypothetical protein